ncbi:polysaccharide deacetylase family protein [Tumebacillus sp. ITR2]|uniref:Polysaccharide deacetylase family protein n=1 Tax=Tumebacillus amylolyticus TaxID=2801339 RepID=A0ABS1J479_9BACL|nr:polysaccharide deacetylase family protein [Tumebacillus amylolyticus]MBL0385075.1 polysaccharide deacetylase family protein [Tumebacillus amylolyticus]
MFSWLPCPARADDKPAGILLLYHTGYENEQVYMRSLFNLMAPFGTSITPINVEEQAPNDADVVELVTHAKYIVLLADRDGVQKLPDSWRLTARKSSAALYFMGENPADVFGATNPVQETVGKLASATTLLIHGNSYPLNVSIDMPLFQLPSPREQVYAEIANGDRREPFISSSHLGAGTGAGGQKRSLFLCLRYTAFGELSFAIADSLFDFFGVDVKPLHEAYVRIEDIHPMRSPEEIRNITDFLSGEGIPFLLGVIPIYQNGGERVVLSDRPELVQALQYAQSKGGTIIQHGTTHQYYLSETGEGYEFWDSANKGPIPDEDTYITDKLELGLKVLLENKLYPVAFEPPHYAMTRHGYEIAARYFSTVVGNLQITDTSFVTMEPPYGITNSYQGGLTFYPENGGYVYEEHPSVVPEMLANMKKVEIVRRSQTGFFFHSYLPLQDLKELVKGMKESGLTPFNLRDYENTVKTPWGTISTANGLLHTDIRPPQESTGNVDVPRSTAQKVSNFVAWGVVSVVTTVIAVFLIQVRILRRRRRARLFAERGELK